MTSKLTLSIYNTLTRQKEIFEPLDERNVRMYVCGPTVYDYAHIGNARPIIVFDIVFRLLQHIYGKKHTTYVRNITDVDDKINERARDSGISIRELTEETVRIFHQDIHGLGVLEPTAEPRATEHIKDMISLIEKLIINGHAYEADGHVLFDVASMAHYGQLSRRSIEDMQAGARVEVAPYKKGAMDFVLWKPSDPHIPGWDSPWGFGRPGWHIECSAMSWRYLGEYFDIHGGGIDLAFPHHENEIAQSCCVFGQPKMANFWMHNGFLQVEGHKMSKSLGNFITIHDLLTKWPGEVLRFNMMRTHYRQPLDWTQRGLEESMKALDAFYESISDVEAGSMPSEIEVALCDDFNTPRAIAALHVLRGKAQKGDQNAAASLKAGANLIGLLDMSADEWFSIRNKGSASVDEKQIEAAIVARNAARKSKDFAEADRIRDELIQRGIILQDGANGTSWDIVR